MSDKVGASEMHAGVMYKKSKLHLDLHGRLPDLTTGAFYVTEVEVSLI